MRTLFSDDIPDPRDIVIISLASACGVFESILSPDELAQVRERIDFICRLDLIGREVAAAIRRVESAPPPAPPLARPYSEIPEAAGLPLLGNVFGMTGDLREFLTREYRKHGPIFRVRALHYRWVALVGPEANVFVSRNAATIFRSWEQYHDFSAALGAHRVLLTMDGPEHIRMRRLLVKGYSPKMLEANLDLAHDVTRRAIEEWPQERPIEIQRAMQQIITEQIGMFCTGLSSEEYFDDLVYYLAMLIQMNVTKRFPKVMERLPKYRRAKRRMEAFYERIMETHQPEMREGQPPDFVDMLLEANQSAPQFLPETDLYANVLAPYLVGMDTSVSVCAFMLYSLLKHPEILERVREEVDEMYEHGPPTPDGLRKLDVTHRAAIETLRMYPVIPALTRTAANSFEFGGYRIPAGTEIMLGTTVGHHLQEYFPEPERFDIERYSRGRGEHLQPGAFAPFGVDRQLLHRQQLVGIADCANPGNHRPRDRTCAGAAGTPAENQAVARGPPGCLGADASGASPGPLTEMMEGQRIPLIRDAGDITVEWMRQALAAGRNSAAPEIAGVEVGRLSDVTNALGNLYRCRIIAQDGEAANPVSVIVKLPSSDALAFRFSRWLSLHRREHVFYRDIAGYGYVRVPALCYGDFDPRSHRFVLVLEDLGDMEAILQIVGVDEGRARHAVREIAGLHGRFWEAAGGPALSGCGEFLNTRERRIMQTVYLLTLPAAFDRFGDMFTAETRRLAEEFGLRIAAQFAAVADGPKTVVHGDFRADNMLFGGEGHRELAVIDWQGFGIGCGMYDVAFFLGTSVTSEVRRRIERDALDEYHEIVCRLGAENYTREDCWRSYRQNVLVDHHY